VSALPFDPARGIALVDPPASGAGSWAGAPGACRDRSDLFVSYRLRRPAPDRGYESRIANVRGGRAETIWSVRKEALAAESIERSALVRARDGWHLYVSHVDASDRKWRVTMLSAYSPDTFDVARRATALHPDPVGVAAVKDPWIRIVNGRWHMFVSCGARSDAPALHATADALSTGIVRSETGLATSADGIDWTWEGVVFRPSADGWDRSTARLTTAIRDDSGWIAAYDGSGSLAENYEERCGIARSHDLRAWERVSTGSPAIGTPSGAGGVRYVDVTERGDVVWEHTRPDGAHELRGILAES
jgi:hypothetical protein